MKFVYVVTRLSNMSGVRIGVRIPYDVPTSVETARVVGNVTLFRIQTLRPRDRFETGIWMIQSPDEQARFLLTVRPVNVGLHLGLDTDLKLVLSELSSLPLSDLEQEMTDDAIQGGYRPIDVELMKGSSGSDYWQTEELSELLWYGQGTGGTNR